MHRVFALDVLAGPRCGGRLRVIAPVREPLAGARLVDLDFGPGPKSLEVRLFAEEEIPWEQLEFRTIGHTLRNYFLDRRDGDFPLHVSSLERRPPVKPDHLGAA